MARVSEVCLKQYKPMKVSELRNPIVFVVDMVEGFIHEGAMHDTKINAISPNIEKLLEGREFRSIFITDSHPPKTREFQSFPQHCIVGTKENEVIAELAPYVNERMLKNSTNTFTCPAFQTFLKEQIDDYKDIIITGCCSDICILQFCLCLNAWLNEYNKVDIRVIVPIDCIDTYHIERVHDAYKTNAFSIQNMGANGICIVTQIKKG